MSAPSRSQSGFTLIELMLVVMIISVLVLSLAPSVSRTVLEQRSGSAARELVRLVREAQLRTMSLRRAHLVYIGEYRVSVLSGVNNHCQMANWEEINNRCTTNVAGRVAGTECLSVDFGAEPWTRNASARVSIREVLSLSGPGEDVSGEEGVSSTRAVCYAPNGHVHHAQDLKGPFTTANTVEGGFLFRVMTWNTEKDRELVPARRVLVPLHGYARVLQ